jgi:hypothetical protein
VTLVPFVRMPPEGDLGLVSTSGPVLSNGTGESVEVAAGPQAHGGSVGKAPGANARLIAFGESRSATSDNKTTVLVSCRSASRHVDKGSKRRVRPATLCGPSRYRRLAVRVGSTAPMRPPNQPAKPPRSRLMAPSSAARDTVLAVASAACVTCCLA